MNPLQLLHEAGQSVWLDFLRRSLISGGGLKRLIDEDSVAGVTSNPTIFGKAIGGSSDYDDTIAAVVEKNGREAMDIFYDLALEDIQMAADVFADAYDNSQGRDGFVSFELEPKLAHDAQASISKAQELFEQLGRPNVMIKVPGTAEGVTAVEELTFRGVNVNITLLFSVAMYEQVALAYVAGLERRLAAGQSVDRIASVASFFVSRVDTAVDRLLSQDSALRGKIAIANAKTAYRRFREIFSGPRWERLAEAGAGLQRPLWASTGTKDPAYSDVLYVVQLVGSDTVNTMPQATMDAFRDHGSVHAQAVAEGVDEAQELLSRLPGEGVDLDAITAQLAEDGIELFDADMSKLLETIDRKVSELKRGDARWEAELHELQQPVTDRLKVFHDEDLIRRIWRKDHTVWKPDPGEISNRLGWLSVVDLMHDRVPELSEFAHRATYEGFEQAVLLGMGGSSLAPEVYSEVFGVAPWAMRLYVLDSTHPAAVAAIEKSINPARTLFIVASKSGETVETLSHFAYFFDKVRKGSQFVAITDAASPLHSLGRERGFREVYLNPGDIGGRYSALSLFGLVPAAVCGVDLGLVLDKAEEMINACHAWVHPEENPGAWLGAVLGEAALQGKDKATMVLPPGLAGFGDWAEQLFAESTGKQGSGVVPVVGEPLGPPDVYGDDRLFMSLGDTPGLEALADAGHPVVRLKQDCGLGAEFFRFEFAVAVAGHVLDINPFDQPNVSEAKRATAAILNGEDPGTPGVDDLESFLNSVRPGDYIAIQAYLNPDEETRGALQAARIGLRDRFRVATTAGFGPRFLHSTGQLHKGGPSTGVFIQVVDASRDFDLPIPGASYSFGSLLDAQASGDLHSLRRHERRVARTTLEALKAAASQQ